MRIIFADVLGLPFDGTTLEKRGLGGSESATVFMARELTRLGHDVTVLNSCGVDDNSPGVYDGVTYARVDVDTIEGDIDVFVSLRSTAPFWNHHRLCQYAMQARHRVLWMHDTFCEGDEHLESMVMQGIINEIFTLSDFHTNYVSNCEHGAKRNFEVLKPHIWQTRNGAHNYGVIKKKVPNRYVYNASVTKGLDPLINDIWPEIHALYPDAELYVIGGYYRFRNDSPPDEQERTLKAFQTHPAYKRMNIHFTGIISQREVAELVASAELMLYPTDFPETFGISTLESLVNGTPVLTNRFGALEETAIDNACYKIPYSTTPNSLFPNIDKNQQVGNFIGAFKAIKADPYLYLQKKHFCSVLKDISGWDTVALEWSNHFNEVFGVFTNRDDFQRSLYQSEKVHRVYGRTRTSRKIWPKIGKELPIVVLSPVWNAEKYIASHIKSVASQDYDNFVHIIMDDASTDKTYEVAEQIIKSLPESERGRTKLTRNITRKGAIQNQLLMFDMATRSDIRKSYGLHGDRFIGMLLDGDDWLIPNNTVFNFYSYEYLKDPQLQMTYGSCWSLADSINLVSSDYVPGKDYPWGMPYTHLRTFDLDIVKNIDKDIFKVGDKWMMAGADRPLFLEMIKKSRRHKAIQEITTVYNDANPNCDFRVNSQEQNKNAYGSAKE